MDIIDFVNDNESLTEMDDEKISESMALSGEDKCFLMVKKMHLMNQLANVFRRDGELSEKDRIRLQSIYNQSICTCVFEYIKLYQNKIIIEGKLTYPFSQGDTDIGIFVHDGDSTTSSRCKILKKEIGKEKGVITYTFRGNILESHKDMRISIFLEEEKTGQKKPWQGMIQFGKVFPLEKSFPSAYVLVGKWMVYYEQGELVFTHPSKESVLHQEEKLMHEFRALHNSGAEKAIRCRCAYHMLKPFLSREIWLLSDRINKADDNGEALFQFLESNKVPEKAIFVLRKDSSDYARVSNYGETVDYLSERHLLSHLLADKIVSSHITGYVRNPFFHNIKYYRDILYGKQQIFLQHGIIKDDLSDSINRYQNYNLSMFVTSAIPEYESIVHGDYGYDESVVKMTGLPRHDYLEDTGGKNILIMPTWRDDLCTWSDYNKTGEKGISSAFAESAFFHFYNSLLNDSTLLECAKENGYNIHFMPHPNMIPHLHYFTRNKEVMFCTFSARYREMLSKGALMLTDYSSVAFDFAYLRKPVVYCRFEDDKKFFSHHTYAKGYFSYEKDGFGEVEHGLQNTIHRLIDYMENGCLLKEIYRERIDKFFPYHDKENCARVYREIKSLEQGISSGIVMHADVTETMDWLNMYMKVIASDSAGEGKEFYEGNISTQYMFPCHLVHPNEKVVLYGVGSVGQTFYWQNKRYQFCQLISCVDQNASSMRDGQIPVEPVQALLGMEYDSVLIAIQKEVDARDVQEFLVDMGIPIRKIKWDGKKYNWRDFYMAMCQILETDNLK